MARAVVAILQPRGNTHKDENPVSQGKWSGINSSGPRWHVRAVELSLAPLTSGLGFWNRIHIFMVQATLLNFLLLAAQRSLIDSEMVGVGYRLCVGKRSLEASERGLGKLPDSLALSPVDVGGRHRESQGLRGRLLSDRISLPEQQLSFQTSLCGADTVAGLLVFVRPGSGTGQTH